MSQVRLWLTGDKEAAQTSLCSVNLLHLPVKSHVALLFATSCKSSFKLFFLIIVTLLLIGRFDLCALANVFEINRLLHYLHVFFITYDI